MASLDKAYTIGMVVGESSGDLLAAGFMQAWLQIYPNTHFVGVGGPRMIALGFESLYSMEDLNVMGLFEPLKRLPRLIKIFNGLKKYFLSNPPDCVIGVDYQEFNLLLESSLKKQGIKTIQYVGPTLWAWRPKRIHRIKKAVDRMLVLFPFETAIYEQHQVAVTCVGHPFADEIPLEIGQSAARRAFGFPENGKVLALMPGSRKQEIKALAEPFAGAALLLKHYFPNLKIISAAVNEERGALAQEGFQKAGLDDVEIIIGRSRDVIAASDAVLLASGTATLETMLSKRPMVVGYKLGWLTYKFAERVVQVPYMAMPNILAGMKIVPEFVQANVIPETLSKALMPFFETPEKNKPLIDKYQELHTMLKRNASYEAVLAVAKTINIG